MQNARPHPSLEAGLSRIENRSALFLTLGAAGATLAVVFALLGTPALLACSGDARGVVTCVRDLIDQRFELPGDIPDAPPSTGAQAEAPLAVSPPLLLADRAGEVAPVEAPAAAPVVVLPDEAVVPADTMAEAIAPVPPRVPDHPPASPPAPVSPGPVAAPPPTAPPVLSVSTPETISPPVAPPAGRPEMPLPLAVAPKPDVPAAETTAAEAEPTSILSVIVPKPPVEATLPPMPETPAWPPVQVVADAKPETAVAQPMPMHLPPRPEPPPVADPVAPAMEAPDPGLDLAELSPLPPAPQAQVVVTPPQIPTIDAIEIDGEDNFVAGDGPAGALMQLYVDDELVGESLVEGGRWLVEGVDILGRLTQTLRIEATDPDTGRSLGNAAISLEIDLPEAEDIPVVPESTRVPPPAPAPAIASDTPLTSTIPPVPVRPFPPAIAEAPVVPEPPPEMPPPLPPAAEESIGTPQIPVPDLDLPEPSRPDSPVAVAPEPKVSDAPVAAPEPRTPSRPPLPPLRTVVPAGKSASVSIIGIAPPGEAALPVVRAFPIGEAAEQRFVTGKAIIRRGDTLWSVARRAYGHGIHFRTIFNANRDLIRRPSRIYPGQVLDLPLVTDD